MFTFSSKLVWVLLDALVVALQNLIAAILLLLPRTAWLGALMALGIISGAIFFHLTSLGIEVMGDGGTLFYLAVGVFVGSAITLFLEREKLIETVQKFTSKS